MDKNNYQIALLIDGDNIEAGLFGAIMNELKAFGKVVYKGVYGDFTKAKPRKWAETAKFNGLDLRYESPIKGKNSADILMVIDAMDLLYVNKNIDCFCIATSDRDFVGLISRLKKDGIFVVGAFEALANEALKNNYDYQILLGDNRAKREPQTARRNAYNVKPTGVPPNNVKQTENKTVILQNDIKPTGLPQNNVKPTENKAVILQNDIKPTGGVPQNNIKQTENKAVILQNDIKPTGLLQNDFKQTNGFNNNGANGNKQIEKTQNNIKPIGNLQNDFKAIGNNLQNDFKPIGNSQNDFKAIGNNSQNDFKPTGILQNDGKNYDAIYEISNGTYDEGRIWAVVKDIVAAYKKDKDGYANFAGVLKKLHGQLKNLPTLKVSNFEKAFDISRGSKGALIKNKEV